MALTQYNKNENTYDGTADVKILIPFQSDHYMMQINYSSFTPGAATAFKLHKVASTNPVEEELVEVAESEQIIADANGIVIYANELPEKADFLVLEFIADGNSGTPVFTVNMSARS